MLTFTVNKNKCKSEMITLNIKSMTIDGKKTVITTIEPLFLMDMENIIFQRINGDAIVFEETKPISVIDKFSFSVDNFEEKNILIESCEEILDMTLPYESKNINALKFTIDDSYAITNRDINVKLIYSKTNRKNTFKSCPNDYVRYDNVFLLKAKTVENNTYKTYYEEIYNTHQNIYFDVPSKGRVCLNCILPIKQDGSDNTKILYWFFNSDDIAIKEYIIKNYKNITFYCEDRRFIQLNDDTFSFTQDFNGNIDSFIKYEKNDLRFNINFNENFNTSLLKNDYYTQFYVDEKIKENINKVIDTEKQIFEPKILGVNNNSGCVLDGLISPKELNCEGIVNEIIINPILRVRQDNDWNNGVILNKYYNNYNGCMNVTDLGFTNEEIRFQKNVLKKSFIRLAFYDTKTRANQSLLYYSTIFYDTNTLFSEYIKNEKEVKNQFKVRSRYDYSNSSEGYYLYLFPNLCKGETETTIYMKVEFNHAKYGKTIPLLLPSDKDYENGYISSKSTNTLGIKKLFNDLYIPIKIRYDKTINKYIWYIERDDVNDYENNRIILTLYEPIVNKEK